MKISLKLGNLKMIWRLCA